MKKIRAWYRPLELGSHPEVNSGRAMSGEAGSVGMTEAPSGMGSCEERRKGPVRLTASRWRTAPDHAWERYANGPMRGATCLRGSNGPPLHRLECILRSPLEELLLRCSAARFGPGDAPGPGSSAHSRRESYPHDIVPVEPAGQRSAD